MKFSLLMIGMLLFSNPVPGLCAGGHRSLHESIIYIEKGDSYISLFDADWFQVYTHNRNTGDEILNNLLPERLAVGTRLVVPAMTFLTDRALKRLNLYESNRKSALKSLSTALELKDMPMLKKSEDYLQGITKLKKAMEVIENYTFGFRNYIHAKEIACDAVGHFKAGINFYDKKIKMDRRNQLLEQKMIAAKKKRNQLFEKKMIAVEKKRDRERIIFLITAGTLFFAGVLFWKKRIYLEKLKKNRIWLEMHTRKIEKFEKSFAFAAKTDVKLY
jgi:hypothetical protein